MIYINSIIGWSSFYSIFFFTFIADMKTIINGADLIIGYIVIFFLSTICTFISKKKADDEYYECKKRWGSRYMTTYNEVFVDKTFHLLGTHIVMILGGLFILAPILYFLKMGG